VATEVGTAYVTLVPSAKGFASKMQSELGGDIAAAGTAAGGTYSSNLQKTTSSRLKSGAGKMFGALKVAGPLAAAAGIAAAGKLIGDSIGEARESQKVSARTANVIKSMGNASKISAKQVGDLSSSISAKSGIDDEAIQSGANLLLTFGNVRNEAGKGNDIFSQTTQLMTDMSAAMGTDAKGSAIQLGKALNDPTKGISALSRVGVSFTQQQKDQVKALQDSGDMLGAQKIIMKEVKGEFGGAAAAIATPADKAKVAWGNFQESIGTALLPVVDKLLTAFTKMLPKVTAFGNALAKTIGPAISAVVGYVGDLIGSFHDSGGQASKTASTISGAFVDVKAIIADFVQIARVLWARFGGDITKYVVGTLKNLVQIIGGALKIIRGIFDIVLGLLTGDWSRVWKGLKEVVGGAWQVIKALVSQALNVIKLLMRVGWKIIKGIVGAAWDGIKALVRLEIRLLVALVKGLPRLMLAALKALGGLLASLFRAAWARAKSAVTDAIGNIVAAVRALPGKLRALGGALKSAGAAIISAFISGLKGGGGFVSDIAGNVWDALRGMINTAIDHINSALSFTIKVGPKSFGVDPPDIAHLASGGRATGATLAVIGEGREPESVLPDSMLRGLLERSAASGQAMPSSLRLVVDGYEFNAYVDARADGAVASAGDLAAEGGRAQWQSRR
jgi:hypothetical protein